MDKQQPQLREFEEQLEKQTQSQIGIRLWDQIGNRYRGTSQRGERNHLLGSNTPALANEKIDHVLLASIECARPCVESHWRTSLVVAIPLSPLRLGVVPTKRYPCTVREDDQTVQIHIPGVPDFYCVRPVRPFQVELHTKTKELNLGTSLRNYIDPRIFKAWAEYVGLDWRKIYTKSLQRKFLWASRSRRRWKPKKGRRRKAAARPASR